MFRGLIGNFWKIWRRHHPSHWWNSEENSFSILREEDQKQKRNSSTLSKAVWEDCYLEIQRHPTQRQWAEVEPVLIRLSKELNIPLVATNDAYYGKLEDAAHDILLCIKNNTHKMIRVVQHYWETTFALRSSEEMREFFPIFPRRENTLTIAEKCNVTIDLEIRFPLISGSRREKPSKAIYAKSVLEGIEKQYGFFFFRSPETEGRKRFWNVLIMNFPSINTMGFPAYFLIVGDFVQWAKSQNILVSWSLEVFAGSLVSNYALTITNIDPIRF